MVRSQISPILIYGDFTRHHLASSYMRAFERINQLIIPFDTRSMGQYLAPWLANRLGHRLTIRSLRLRSLGSIRWNNLLLTKTAENRVKTVFILNGNFVMPETVEALRNRNVTVLIFHADNPFRPYASHRPETLPTALHCNSYFIWSRHLAKRLAGTGISRVEYLPFAWDHEVFPYEAREIGSRASYDVVFIGGWDREREQWLESVAQRFDLHIWGPPYWITRTKSRSRLRKCWQGAALYGSEAANMVRKACITLNLMRTQNMPDGTNMRTFEVPGCGGFQIATRTTGALELFPEESGGIYFSTEDELLQRISDYLSSDLERTRIAAEAHQITARKHQYIDRARQVISICNDL